MVVRRPLGWALAAVGVAQRGRKGPTATGGRPTCRGACALAAEALGPTYIKLGQIISSGEGLFPPELVERVQAVPRPGAGRSRSTSCAAPSRPTSAGRSRTCSPRSTTTPLAAASIAQVHAARLRTGEEVVVKVQRPDVARLVHHDLRAMAWLAPHLVGRIPVASLANPPALVELFAETIVEELDFRIEAANMLDIAAMLRELEPDRLRRAPAASRRSSPGGCW